MSPLQSSATCATTLLLLCLTTPVQAFALTKHANNDRQDEVIERITDTFERTAEDVGEASYNVANCQALIDDNDAKADGEGNDSGPVNPGGDVKQLDLDKCRRLLK